MSLHLVHPRGGRGSLRNNHPGRYFVSGTIGALGVSRLGFTLILIALHSVNQVGTVSIPHKHCSTKSLTVIVSITAEEGTVGWTVPDIMNKIDWFQKLEGPEPPLRKRDGRTEKEDAFASRQC